MEIDERIKNRYMSIDVARKLKEKGYPQTLGDFGGDNEKDANTTEYLEQTMMIYISDEPQNMLNYGGCEISGYLESWYLGRRGLEYFLMPDIYEIQRWLRDKHRIHVCAVPVLDTCNDEVYGCHYECKVISGQTDRFVQYSAGGNVNTPEDALKSGIVVALGMI